jgi:uncharacterized membrane protein
LADLVASALAQMARSTTLPTAEILAVTLLALEVSLAGALAMLRTTGVIWESSVMVIYIIGSLKIVFRKDPKEKSTDEEHR